MYRTVAFASWLDQLGQLKFVTEDETTRDDFFVPRVLARQELQRKPREKIKRFFPEKNDGQSIALYLGAKLVGQGSVAVFCGRKSTAASMCDKIIEAYDRGFALQKPIEYSDKLEVECLSNLYPQLGTERFIGEKRCYRNLQSPRKHATRNSSGGRARNEERQSQICDLYVYAGARGEPSYSLSDRDECLPGRGED
jgi:hypothetical protein